MSTARNYKTMKGLAIKLRDDLNNHDFVLLYAYNGTGKTRISMAFKDKGKDKNQELGDTLYFNAFTEDLFTWDNDLDNDVNRVLNIKSESRFFNGLQELEMENRIRPYLHRYADFDFFINYQKWTISFNRVVNNQDIIQTIDNIKISRGEENIFIWCFFLAVAQLAVDEQEAYSWVKYIYIDDPISSLDDNNAIAVASDLSKLLNRGKDKIRAVISSHHNLFFNVICNELKKSKHKRYFLYKKGNNGHRLLSTDDTPFFHHVAMLSELKQVTETGEIYTHHFNMLRSILEKTSTFFGYKDFSDCIHGIEDEVLYARALNLLSHGKYSVYEPVVMGEDTKQLFLRILDAFLNKYQFQLPGLLIAQTTPPNQS